MNDETKENPAKSKKFISIAFWVFIITVLIIGGVYYYHYSSLHPATDDAYVQANTIQVAAQVSGPVAQIFVQNNQKVKKGQLLFTIDPKPFQYAVNKAAANLQLTQQEIEAQEAAVNSAKADLAEAQANYNVAKQNVPRTLQLAKEKTVSKAEGVSAAGQLESAKAAMVSAQAKLQQAIRNLGQSGDKNANYLAAKAALDQAQLNLSYTKIIAPGQGYLVNFAVRPGTMITAGSPLFALVENNQWWVNANYKETDLERIHSGQSTSIVLEIYPHHTFKGKVQSISSGSGAAFSLLPPENATGNWVKVTQRFPVKIMFENPNPAFPLRVGASATVSINTVK